MICPRCSTEAISDSAPGCPNCGYTLGDTAGRTEAPAPEPVSQELEQALRRELGGQYEITDLLGRGGMSLVYLAQEAELNRQVAIKVLPLQFVHGPAAAERFEREAKIAASLDHPHIVPIFRVGATSTFLWYTMKRVRGRSLEHIIAERGALSVDEVLVIVEQVGSALQYAHRHGVVHRDIKPANVMIEENGWALVCDFGVARAFGSVSLTQTGASLGTPRYMSPEQFEGQPVDGRCDQYSLAILVWEALTGAVPFTGDSLGELIRKHLLEPPPRLTDVKPEIARHVSVAVHRAMGKKPGERFPDIAAFVAALEGKAPHEVLAGFTRPTPVALRARVTPEAPTVLLPPRARRRSVLVASVIVGVTVLGATLWVTLQPGRSVNGATPDRTAGRGTAVDTQPVATAPPVDTPTERRPSPPPPPRRDRATEQKDTRVPVLPAAAPARLSVSTQPWGTLYLDGKLIRNTPITNLEIAPGPHRVRVSQDGFVPFDTTFNAAPGQEIRLTRRALKPIGG